MIRIITKKCPCGYLFKEKRQIEIQTIPASRMITCKPGIGPVFHDKPTKKEKVIKREVLDGDEEFEIISVLVDYYRRTEKREKMKLLVCPKCGTILMPTIAMQTNEEEMDEQP